jgi:hypothetical protein
MHDNEYQDLSDGSDIPGSADLNLFQGLASVGEIGERIIISGARTTPLNLSIKRTAEIHAKRDAIVLEALLSTSVDRETWAEFVEIITAKYALKSEAVKDYLQALLMANINRAQATKKTRKTRAKTEVTLAEPEPESEEE